MTQSSHPVFCAIDTPDIDRARSLVAAATAAGFGVKLGKEFFSAQGAAGIRAVVPAGTPLFLDLKFHDIPNTVASALKAVAPLKPTFITLHAAGGPGMLKAAAEAVRELGADRPKLLGVTVLTSLDQGDLAAIGVPGSVEAQVLRLARLAMDCGIDGIVAAPSEIGALRAALGPKAILVIPGIRPAGSAADDQKRVLTPAEALSAGASWLVIGRPITAAADPAGAARAIAAELAAAA